MEEEERKRIEEIKEQERQQASEAIEKLKIQSENRQESTSGLDSDDDVDDDGYAGDDGEFDTQDDDNNIVNQNKTIINGYKDQHTPADSPKKILSKTKAKTQARSRIQSKLHFVLGKMSFFKFKTFV